MGRVEDIIDANKSASGFSDKGISKEETFTYLHEAYPHLSVSDIDGIVANYSFPNKTRKQDFPKIQEEKTKKEDSINSRNDKSVRRDSQYKKGFSIGIIYALLSVAALGGAFFIGTKTNTNNGFPRGLEDALETKLQRNIQKRGINMLNEGGYPTIESSDGTTYFYAKCNEFVRGLYLTEKKGRLIFCAYKKEHNFQPPKNADILYLFTADLDFESKNVDVNPYKIKQNK